MKITQNIETANPEGNSDSEFVTLDIVDTSGNKVDELKVSSKLFRPPNEAILWYYKRAFLLNQRQETHDTKTRSDVRGGGRKPWPQKHTGRARQGSIRNPHWVGGAVAHGPHPQDHYIKLSKNEKREAVRSTISLKYHEGKLKIINDFDFDAPKTKTGLQLIKNIDAYPLTLVTTSSKRNVYLSFRNIPLTSVLPVENFNAYEPLKYDFLVFEKQAFIKIIERLEKKED